MIAGFIVQGQADEEVVVRGLGPSLTQKGVIGALTDPTLTLVDANGTQLAVNDDYASESTQDLQTLTDQGLTPTDSHESAIVADLPAGTYTAILRGKSDGFGLVEIYDITSTRVGNFANISTRATVQEGDNGAVIAGFIIQAPATGVGTPQKVLIRALGPSLTSAGVSGTLADPTLDLYRGSDLIMSNDDWQTGDEAGIVSTGIPPTDPKESALLMTLDPGTYTAVIRGAGDTTGVSLVEVYQLQ